MGELQAPALRHPVRMRSGRMDPATLSSQRPEPGVLFERNAPATFRLPMRSFDKAAGRLGLAALSTMYANFVSSVDGWRR